MFRDRHGAGSQLAKKILECGGEISNGIVVALPRGGVVVGYEVARGLGLPLDILAVRKIGYPGDSEFAVGAVDEQGATLFDKATADSIDPEWLKKETENQRNEAVRRATLYRGNCAPHSLEDKTIILVDDGIATGRSMQLAARIAKAKEPKRIIIAVPVAPAEAIDMLAREADEIIVLEQPENFLGAVGAHYEIFDQVGDAEVIRLMEHSRNKDGAIKH